MNVTPYTIALELIREKKGRIAILDLDKEGTNPTDLLDALRTKGYPFSVKWHRSENSKEIKLVCVWGKGC